MAKTKLTVTHEGQTFTRTTDRTYSHVILCKRNRALDVKRATEGAAWHAKHNFAYFVQETGPNPKYLNQHSPERLAKYREYVSMGQEGYEAHLLACQMERINKIDYDQFFAFAWAGRPDLAAKQVDKACAEGFLDVVAVAV